MILEALADNAPEAGLWSVDLPLLSGGVEVIASAVPDRLRSRWTYVRGPSRRVLRKLFERTGGIDLFLQDSRSTVATASFEFETAWRALQPGGLLIANSVDCSLAFAQFVDVTRPSFAVTARFERKPGLFGIARKAERPRQDQSPASR